MTTLPDLTRRLNDRRDELGLSCRDVARLSGVDAGKVRRLLSGEEARPTFAAVCAIAEVLGVAIGPAAETAESVRRRRAEAKAEWLVGLVQGTSALEAQAVGEDAIRDMRERTTRELLDGPRRRLWGE